MIIELILKCKCAFKTGILILLYSYFQSVSLVFTYFNRIRSDGHKYNEVREPKLKFVWIR